MDDLTTLFIKKVSDLERCISSGNNIQDIHQSVIELRNWLASDRYIKQHRTCQAFLTYLWRTDAQFSSREGFVSWVKCKVGFADINVSEAVIEGQKVVFKKFLPWSLSFGSCSQKRHNEFLNKLKDFAESKYKINFDDWLEEYETNPELI